MFFTFLWSHVYPFIRYVASTSSSLSMSMLCPCGLVSFLPMFMFNSNWLASVGIFMRGLKGSQSCPVVLIELGMQRANNNNEQLGKKNNTPYSGELEYFGGWTWRSLPPDTSHYSIVKLEATCEHRPTSMRRTVSRVCKTWSQNSSTGDLCITPQFGLREELTHNVASLTKNIEIKLKSFLEWHNANLMLATLGWTLHSPRT